MSKIISLLFLLFVHCITALSQNTICNYNLESDTIRSLYSKKMHAKTDFILGREYKLYHFNRNNSPFLNSREGEGTIYTQGRTFPDLILSYDIYKDELIINTFFSSITGVNVKLQKARIDSFSMKFINDKIYHFKHLRNDRKGPNQIASGFYEIPYSGRWQLLYKHYAKKEEDSSNITYIHNTNKYLKINKLYYNIDTKKQFLELFKPHKKLLKKKFRLFNTTYKKLSKLQLIDLLTYAESL